MSAIMNSLPSYPVDQREVDKFLKCFDDDEERSFMEKTIGKIQHITFALLAEKLEECVQSVNPYLANRNYAVGFAPEKSSEWVYDLVKDSLSNEPSSFFYLENTDTSGVTVTQRILETDLSHIKEDTIVLFDDCGYSGTQIQLYLNLINGEYKKRNVKPTVYVVIPFLSEKALESANGFSFINVNFITSNYKIKNFEEIYTNEELVFFKYANPESPMFIFCGSIKNTLTLCYTDWRCPDSMSFPKGLTRYAIQNKHTKELVRYSIIPPIPRIYGKLKGRFS